MTWCPRQMALSLSLFPRLPLPFLLPALFQGGRTWAKTTGPHPQAPDSSEQGRTFQEKAQGADKQARLNSVSSFVLGVITTPSCLPLCPALPCPAHPTQGALQVAEGESGQGEMGGLQQHLGMGDRILTLHGAQTPRWLTFLGTWVVSGTRWCSNNAHVLLFSSPKWSVADGLPVPTLRNKTFIEHCLSQGLG